MGNNLSVADKGDVGDVIGGVITAVGKGEVDELEGLKLGLRVAKALGEFEVEPFRLLLF